MCALQHVADGLVHHQIPLTLAQQGGVAGIGRPRQTLVGARQRGHAHGRVKRESMTRFAVVEGFIQVLQLRGDEAPVVQRLLHAGGDARRIMRSA